jgi:hypothetical protein
MRLDIELVPHSQWYNNLRSQNSRRIWDELRNACYKRAGFRCEVCGDQGINQGVKHTVECHEIWEYDVENEVQKLTGLIALCPFCHKTKHAGLALQKNELWIVELQLMRVNNISQDEAQALIFNAFKLWGLMNKINWKQDVSIVDYLIQETDYENKLA